MKFKGVLLLLLMSVSVVLAKNKYSQHKIFQSSNMPIENNGIQISNKDVLSKVDISILKLTYTPKISNDTIDINADEILHIDGIDITPMKITNRENFVETKSARKTGVMRINFYIENNKYIKPGYKDVYILIQNPKGVILNRKGTFDVYGGYKLHYTAKTEAYYENNFLKISILTDKFIQKMVKGVYTVIIYIENYPVGLESIRLR